MILFSFKYFCLFFKNRLIYIFLFILFFNNVNAFNSITNELFIDESNKNINYILANNSNIKISKDNRILELFKSKDEKIPLSYIFYTTDIINTVAYSGKPLEILISLMPNGVINDLKLIKHSEPILLTGIPIEKLLEALSFYKDKNINNKISIGEDTSAGISVPIIAGATVTSLILHETILEASREVGFIFGFVNNYSLDGGLNNKFKKYTWDDLLKNGAIKHFKLDNSLKETNDVNELIVDIYFTDLLHPSIGKNLLGDNSYNDLFLDSNNISAILILNNGSWSFKGSGFVRGGIFDRFRIEQNGSIFTFRDNDLKNVYDLNFIDIDDFRESGIFLINNSKYKPWKPWNLILLLNYKTFSIEYKLPDVFCVNNNYPWLEQWDFKIFNLSLLFILWISVIFVFIFRNMLAKNTLYLSIIYNIILLLDIYIIGFLLKGQPSIVNLFALKEIKTFLWDPYLCLAWIMIFLTIFIWGKAIFCGWICPFGAMQELLFKFKSLFFNNISFEFSEKTVFKVKYVRYIILFFLIFFALFKGVAFAEFLAEIEPFKTTWSVGIFNREWYISFYTLILLFLSIFTYRIFCRFICPLGAFLSLLSIFIIFKLNRRGSCGHCHICEIKCNSKAIDKSGKINSKECFGCFTCVNNMYNKKLCPPLINKKIWDKYETGKWLI